MVPEISVTFKPECTTKPKFLKSLDWALMGTDGWGACPHFSHGVLEGGCHLVRAGSSSHTLVSYGGAPRHSRLLEDAACSLEERRKPPCTAPRGCPVVHGLSWESLLWAFYFLTCCDKQMICFAVEGQLRWFNNCSGRKELQDLAWPCCSRTLDSVEAGGRQSNALRFLASPDRSLRWTTLTRVPLNPVQKQVLTQRERVRRRSTTSLLHLE